MSKVARLLESYGRHIAVPWRSDAAPDQRVILCVYKGTDELRLRARIGEFELATRGAGHGWAAFDLTDTFASWLTSVKYASQYFEKPESLASVLPKYLDRIVEDFQVFLRGQHADENSVVALVGAGSLFGLLKVKEVVDKLKPLVKGRLLVFFPGTFQDNNYRLLDGYDGWNYLAVPITADRDE